jgi:hypothetical protein
VTDFLDVISTVRICILSNVGMANASLSRDSELGGARCGPTRGGDLDLPRGGG